MASAKTFYTRMQHKHDTEENWLKATNFIPLEGEIIIYDADDTHNYSRTKIGDGITNVNALSFTLIDDIVYSSAEDAEIETAPINADTLGGFEPAYFKNATTLNGKTEETIITNVLKKIYPVGAIYSSMTSTSPATLFGFGTWTRIEGKFLLGANSTYAAGTSGGEATHTLTINEIPWHDHSVRVDWHDTAAKTNTAVAGSTPITANSSYSGNLAIDRSGGQGTEGTGGSQSHNNMPPYLAVYMWQRTA